MLSLTALVMAAGALLSGCTSSQTPKAVADASERTPQGCPGEANLLRDPTFATLSSTEQRPSWSLRQHSRGQDFTATASGGTLTFSQVGHEPWAIVTQRHNGPFMAGSEWQFDATVSMATFEPEHKHELGYYAGLYLLGRKGRQPVLQVMAEHQPNLGQHDTQKIVMRTTLETNLDSLDSGFIHQAGGSFTVSEPRLIDVSRYPGCRLP